MTINTTLFQQYDSLHAESQALHGVDGELSHARQALSRDAHSIKGVDRSLVKTRESIDHHEKKLASCQFGWRSNSVLQPDTWFSGGVQARVERQAAKLKAKEDERANLLESHQALQKRINQLHDTVLTLESAHRRKCECDDQTAAMYSRVVDTLATPALATLRAQRQQWTQAVDFEATNAAALEQAAAKCGFAHKAYTHAAQALAQAQRTNQNAQFANTLDIFTPGPGFGLEIMETVGQVQRDQLMHTARQQVEVGGRVLQEAMRSLPPAALQRYPQQCAGLGDVHLPKVELTGGGELMLEVFGGDFGDMIANSSAEEKIGRSLQALDECIRIVAHQQGLIHALLLALRADGARATSGLRQADAEVARESERIWQEARARAFGGGGGVSKSAWAPPPAPTVAVAVPVTQTPIVVQGLPVATTVQ